MRPAHRQLFTADDGEGIPCPGNLPDIHKIALVDSDKIAGKLGLQVIQLTPEAFSPLQAKAVIYLPSLRKYRVSRRFSRQLPAPWGRR